MKSFRRIVISLSVVFLGICCGAILLFNWSALGWKALTVPTGSMRPTIPPGSLVLMHSVPYQSLKVGDVITYANLQRKGSTITHRIVKVESLGSKVPLYTTKGDANPSADPQKVVAGQVQGRAIWSTPHVGTWLNWSKGWVGLAFLIYVPALFIMFEEVTRLGAYYKTKRLYVLRHNWTIRKDRAYLTGNPVKSAFISVAMLFVASIVAVPVYALLASNTVALAPNNLTVAPITPPPAGAHVTFKVITLRCSSDNTLLTSKRPKIVIQNWTSQTITTHNWRIVDNSGTIITIPNGTMLKKLHSYTFTPLLADGLQYAGDHLAILNDNGQVVDTLSWGTDTSAFNPAIAVTAAGSRLDRRPFNVDTNKASDWRLTNHVCHCPLQPDLQAGDDTGDLGDLSELNRVTTVGAFNMSED